MRLTLVAVLFAVAAGAATAADLDPRSLALGQADVPADFRVDLGDTGVRTNEAEAKDEPRLRALYARVGRVTGYESEFDRGAETISSRIDVLRTARGADRLVDWFALEMRKAGIRGLRRREARIGAEGWAFSGSLGGGFTIVVWRRGRVFAGVAVTDLGAQRALALARLVDRRIVSALR